jgi:hypothetical protein
MIKIKRKPFAEIRSMLEPYTSFLNVGCGGCASVCLGGGQKETRELNAELELMAGEKAQPMSIQDFTVERACNMFFLQDLDSVVQQFECLGSMACSAGTQLMAERFPDKPVFPMVNTLAIGVDREVGVYEENCRACGDCVIGYTGGLCPVTRCAKGLFNGPCGGTQPGGMCEVDVVIPCVWHEIYDRLSRQGRVGDILKVRDPMEWRNQVRRMVVQEPYQARYLDED